MVTKPATPRPTESELELLGILWERGSLTVRELFEAVNVGRPVVYTYKLDPFKTTPQGELRDRAETLRSEARVLPKPRRGGILAWFGFTD